MAVVHLWFVKNDQIKLKLPPKNKINSVETVVRSATTYAGGLITVIKPQVTSQITKKLYCMKNFGIKPLLYLRVFKKSKIYLQQFDSCS